MLSRAFIFFSSAALSLDFSFLPFCIRFSRERRGAVRSELLCENICGVCWRFSFEKFGTPLRGDGGTGLLCVGLV